MNAIRKRVRAVKDGDRGFSLVELIVSMGIFSVVLVVFLAAVSAMARTTADSTTRSDSADQLRIVFQRFDKEVRYASDINTPATANGSIYLEYWVPASAANGSSLCVQWRYVKESRELQRRTWTQGSASSVTPWLTMATGLRNDLTQTSEQPFVVRRAGTSGGKVYLHQRLEVYLDATANGVEVAAGSELKTIFVAQNSSTGSVTNPGATNVCLIGTVQRP